MQVMAVILSAALISSVVAYFLFSPGQISRSFQTTKDQNLVLGPRLLVQDPSYSGSNSSSAITTSLQVFSTVPDAFNVTGQKNFDLQTLNITNNPRYVELLNTTITSNTSVKFLSGEFNNISDQWKYLFSNNFISSEASLTVLAYRTVYMGSTISVYQYYNNIQYTPQNLEDLNSTSANTTVTNYWFTGSSIDPSSYHSVSYDNLSMNLSIVFPQNPSQVYRIHSGGQPVYSTYAVPDYVNYTDSQDMHSDVILPLLGVHLSSSVSSGKSAIDFYSDFPNLNDGLFFNSANVYDPVSGNMSSTMSIVPSFSNTGGESTLYTLGSTNVTPQVVSELNGLSAKDALNSTTAITGITGVTYSFVHYAEYTAIYGGNIGINGGSPDDILDGNGLISQISSIVCVNGPVFMAERVPIEVDSVIHSLMEGPNNGTVTLNDTGLTSMYFGSTIQSNAPGYSSAAHSFDIIKEVQSTFLTPIGLGLALSDTLSVLNSSGSDLSMSNIVTDSFGMINGTTGLTEDAPAMMSTISYVAGYFPGGVSSAFSNSPAGMTGSNYSIQYYESPYPVSFTDSSDSTYSFYAPEDYLNATALLG